MSQVEVKVVIYGPEKPASRPNQINSLENIKIGDLYRIRCDLTEPESPNPYLEANREELIQVLEKPEVIGDQTWLMCHKFFIYHDTGRIGEYDQKISLADQGVLPDHRGLWNQVNWLEKI